jgi:membrane associated rhomboid family serine protease
MQIAKWNGKNGCVFVGIWTHNHFLKVTKPQPCWFFFLIGLIQNLQFGNGSFTYDHSQHPS